MRPVANLIRSWLRRGAMLALVPLLAALLLLLDPIGGQSNSFDIAVVSLTVDRHEVFEGETVTFTFKRQGGDHRGLPVFFDLDGVDSNDWELVGEPPDDREKRRCLYGVPDKPFYTIQKDRSTLDITIRFLRDGTLEGPESMTMSISWAQCGSQFSHRLVNPGDPSSQTVTIYDSFSVLPDGAYQVPSDWSLVPDGLTTGDQFRLIFVTSTKRRGDSTDIEVYNEFVNAAAARNSVLAQTCCPLLFGFKALGSTTTIGARVNLSMWDFSSNKWADKDANIPTYWIGTDYQVAPHYQRLFSDWGWKNEDQARDESGTLLTEEQFQTPVATGTDKRGRPVHNPVSAPLGGLRITLEAGLLNESRNYVTPVFNSSRVQHGLATHNKSLPFYGVSPVFEVGD